MSEEVKELARFYGEYASQHMPYSVDLIRFRRKPGYVGANLSALSDCHIKLGIRDYILEKNISSFKQNLHVATKLQLESIRLHTDGQFQIGSEILWALLTDNSSLIDEVAHFETEEFAAERRKPSRPQYWVHMIQLAILGDYEQLEAKISDLGKRGQKNERALYAERRDFFSLLLREDKAGLEDLILKESRSTEDGAVLSKFLSFIAAMEAKICWRKGINVEIDSPYLPMDLMPARALAYYDDLYDFLVPGYIPPKIGLWERFSHSLRKQLKS
jgi:hypothetical protein